jgi:hypothetical protein
MRIGLISDTHVYHEDDRNVSPEILEAFVGVDLILHCGDIFALSVLDSLEAISPVIAVPGFGDSKSNDHRVEGPTRVVNTDGISIGMIHYINWPGQSLEQTDGTLEFPPEPIADVLRGKFDSPVDVVVFGDSHQESITTHEGVLFVNPGSPYYPMIKLQEGDKGTVAILSISQGKASAEILRL